MMYERPEIERRRLIGQMAITSSECPELGGTWEGNGICSVEIPDPF